MHISDHHDDVLNTSVTREEIQKVSPNNARMQMVKICIHASAFILTYNCLASSFAALS